ncbi:MAG TPA: sulfatase [Vicinamibacteria bacterium]|nr:sulfatase [Vicinamibacteria bacterium]
MTNAGDDGRAEPQPPSLEVWVQSATHPARLVARHSLAFSQPVEEVSIDLAHIHDPGEVLLTVVPNGADPLSLEWLSAEIVGETEERVLPWRAHSPRGQRNNTGSLPDIVLYVVDTLRADHLGCYGSSVPTPNFDRLAAEGILFENALSTSSWTKPSTASLLTGLYPSTHGALDRPDRLPESAFTLAERLRLRGYSTVAVTANSNIDPVWGFDQGFELFVRPEVPDRDPEGRATRNLHAEEVQEIALAEWRRRKAAGEGPLFLYVHVVDPHGPYDPPEWLLEQPRPESLVDTNKVQVELNTRRREATEELLSAMDALYSAEVAYVDRAFGRFLEALDGSNEAIVVLTSDHGEGFQEHGFSSHGMSLFDEELRIPLVFFAPRMLPRGVVIRDRVSLVDVVPTLLGLIGQPMSDTPGVDLKEWSREWQPAIRRPRPLIAELDYDGRLWLSLHLESMKLVQNLVSKENHLFDVDTDRGETLDLISGDRGAAERMLLTLEVEHARLVESRLQRETAPLELPESVKENLRALGYVQ